MAHGSTEEERLRAELDAMTREYHYQRGVIETLRQERADERDRREMEEDRLKSELWDAHRDTERHLENAKAAQAHAEEVARQFSFLLEIARNVRDADDAEARRLALIYFREHP